MQKIKLVDAKRLAKKHNYNGRLMEFYMGLNVEMEHSGVVHGDVDKIAEIVIDHLEERKDYYSYGLKTKFFDRKEVGLK